MSWKFWQKPKTWQVLVTIDGRRIVWMFGLTKKEAQIYAKELQSYVDDATVQQYGYLPAEVYAEKMGV